MFTLLKIISVFALLDYIIFSFYKKQYAVDIHNDSYKYRIIICYIFWFLLGFFITFNLLGVENNSTYFIYTTIIAFILYIMINIYNKYKYKNYTVSFICVDIVFGIIIANIIVFISLAIK